MDLCSILRLQFESVYAEEEELGTGKCHEVGGWGEASVYCPEWWISSMLP